MTDRRLNGLNNLINELFELTKLNSPSFEMNFIRADIICFLKQFVYEMNAILNQNDLNLTCFIDNKEFVMDADFERLTRVMQNLFANVIKYAAAKTEVTFESEIHNDQMCIRLSNTIREDSEIDTENMFNRFYKEDQSRTDTESSGLGLAIAKRIVELHYGKIFASLNEKIITITIYL